MHGPRPCRRARLRQLPEVRGGTQPATQSVAAALEKAYAWGRSQTGRCLRDFVHAGFNADAQADASSTASAACRRRGPKWLNHRFASPIVSGGQQYEDHFNVADSFPFSYAWSTDHHTGKQDAILKRPDTDPLVFHTQTATEYWVRRGSLAHTDTQGNDLATTQRRCGSMSGPARSTLPIHSRNRRRAAWASSFPTSCVLPCCSAPCSTRWILGDRRHAARQPHPRRADGTLVSIEEWLRQFPHIPGVATPPARTRCRSSTSARMSHAAFCTSRRPSCPGQLHGAGSIGRCGRQHFGGVRAPMVAAPLATYTGWNLARAATARVPCAIQRQHDPVSRHSRGMHSNR